MSNHAPSRISAGVRQGGQFAAEARAETGVALAGPEHGSTHVTVGGHVGPNADQFAEALQATPGLGDVEFWSETDQELGRFVGTATIHGQMYSISTYDNRTYTVNTVGSGYREEVGYLDEIGATLGESLRKVRAKDISEQVRRDAADQYPGQPRRRAADALSITGARAEAGFAMPGDHIKVSMSRGAQDPRLFARSAIKDAGLPITPRQQTMRLNKVLDRIGPHRKAAEQHLRTYLNDTGQAFDERAAADPLLAG